MKRKKAPIAACTRSLIAICLLLCTDSLAQDVHFSQFYESTILRNPGLTGAFTGDYRISAQYRSQWNSITNPFQTAQVSAETKFPVSNGSSDFFSFGFLAYYDRSGAINLRTTGVYPAITYHKSLEDEHKSFLSVGFTGGYLQRSVDVSRMTFDNQYGAGGFNPDNPTGEIITNPTIRHWDVGAGINFSTTTGANDEFTWFIGAGGYHFTRPKRSFLANTLVTLDMRWNGNLGLQYKLSEQTNLQLQGNYARQGSYQEIMVGGLASWSPAGRQEDAEFTLSGGAFYRANDALIPVVRIDYRRYTVGMSYDVNVSRLRTASNLRGGYEISLTHNGLFRDPRWEKARTICPGF